MFRAVVLIIVLTLWATAQTQLSDNGLTVKRVVGMTYPRLAQLAAVQGEVELVVTVSGDGKVQAIRLLAGSGLLAPAAKDALSKWRFAGCAPGGTCDMKIVFSFVLCGQCELPNCPTEFQVDLPSMVQVKSALARAIVN
jgi:TonB family protein